MKLNPNCQQNTSIPTSPKSHLKPQSILSPPKLTSVVWTAQFVAIEKFELEQEVPSPAVHRQADCACRVMTWWCCAFKRFLQATKTTFNTSAKCTEEKFLSFHLKSCAVLMSISIRLWSFYILFQLGSEPRKRIRWEIRLIGFFQGIKCNKFKDSFVERKIQFVKAKNHIEGKFSVLCYVIKIRMQNRFLSHCTTQCWGCDVRENQLFTGTCGAAAQLSLIHFWLCNAKMLFVLPEKFSLPKN